MQDSSASHSGDSKATRQATPEPHERGNQTLRRVNGRAHVPMQGDLVAAYDFFVSTVDRLEQILDRETEMLVGRQVGTQHDFNREKRLALVELTHCLAALREREWVAAGFDGKPILARLRHRIEANLTALETHMKAVGEVAACIARAIVEYESDGTYSAKSNGKGIVE
jgi:hypothetical protein